MRRVWAGFGQAVESAAIAAVGLLLCALVLLAVWGIDQGFGGDPLAQWRIAADAWMLGHGVDLSVSLGREAVVAVGLETASRPFAVTIGAWGIGFITLWLHWRSGHRLAELALLDAGIAVASGAIATGAVGLLAGVSAAHPSASPDLVQAFVLPALVALLGMAAAIVRTHGHAWLDAAARGLTIEDRWMRAIRAGLRTGAGGAVGVLGVGALLAGVGIFVRFTEGLLIMESLQVTHLGVVVLFLVQLALAPVAIVWGASWATGAGFMIGRGSHVSPLGSDLGPVPAMPLLSAVDPEAAPWMLVVVALPVVAAVVVGAIARQTILAGSTSSPVHWCELAIAAVGGGLLAGALLGTAAALSTGAIGPGRLEETGPDPVLVAAWAALEVTVGLAIGLAAGGRGSGALAGGFAVPLAAEGAGSTMRDFLGLGASADDRDADEPEEKVDASGGDADAGDRVDADTEVVEPLVVREAEAVAPLVAEQESGVIAVSDEDRAETQAAEPVAAADPVGAAGSGEPDATDGAAEPARGGERTHRHPSDGRDPAAR